MTPLEESQHLFIPLVYIYIHDLRLELVSNCLIEFFWSKIQKGWGGLGNYQSYYLSPEYHTALLAMAALGIRNGNVQPRHPSARPLSFQQHKLCQSAQVEEKPGLERGGCSCWVRNHALRMAWNSVNFSSCVFPGTDSCVRGNLREMRKMRESINND